MEKIVTQHPGGKRGAAIDKDKYETIRKAITETLKTSPMITYIELSKAVEKKLPTFSGAIAWYVECVKLDLEARKTIERTYTIPEKYRLL